jgi:hypothetical protein
MWHAPRYACGGSHSDDTEMQDMWADLYDAGVDFLFVGHNHYYQRWLPLDKTIPEAITDLDKVREANEEMERIFVSGRVPFSPIKYVEDTDIPLR